MVKINNLKNFWKNKKVLVTGHTGFKGSWLIIILNLLGAKVYGYSLKPNKKSLFNEINGDKIIQKNFYGNLNDFKNLKLKINQIKPNVVFHLAAQPLVIESYKNALNTHTTNIMGTVNLLEICRKTKSIDSIVVVTTDKVYKIKSNKNNFSEDDELGGDDPYSASKACSEIVTLSYIKSFFNNSRLRFKVSTARSGNVIGGGDYSKNRLVPDIINSVNNQKKLIIRNPKSIRPWQHVVEPLIGYILLAQKQVQKKININPSWNFGPEKNNFLSVLKIVNISKKFEKINLKIINDNKFKETFILKLKNKKSKEILNWKPRWNLYKSLEKVFDWNKLKKRKINVRKICESQVNEYLGIKK